MTIRNMIDAARNGNPADFEKAFQPIVAERLSAALDSMKTNVVAKMFGLSEAMEDAETEVEIENED